MHRKTGRSTTITINPLLERVSKTVIAEIDCNSRPYENKRYTCDFYCSNVGGDDPNHHTRFSCEARPFTSGHCKKKKNVTAVSGPTGTKAHLNEGLHAQLAARFDERVETVQLQNGHNQEHGVRPVGPGFEKLVLVDDEIFPQDGRPTAACARNPHAKQQQQQ